MVSILGDMSNRLLGTAKVALYSRGTWMRRRIVYDLFVGQQLSEDYSAQQTFGSSMVSGIIFNLLANPMGILIMQIS